MLQAIKSWLGGSRSSLSSQQPAPVSLGTNPHRARLGLESLEAREVPTTFSVTNSNDSGAGSLRQAILDSYTGAPDNIAIVNFTVSTQITLQSPLPQLGTKLYEFNGITANSTVIRRNQFVFPFTGSFFTTNTLNSQTVTFNNITMVNGDAGSGNGGAIFATCPVYVNNCQFAGNKAAHGGAIWSNGPSLNINNSSFKPVFGYLGNSATGNGGAIGVGVFTVGTGAYTTITNSTFSGNAAANGGAIYSYQGIGYVSISGSILENNSIPNANGGGSAIYTYNGSLMVDSNTWVRNNIGGSAAAVAENSHGSGVGYVHFYAAVIGNDNPTNPNHVDIFVSHPQPGCSIILAQNPIGSPLEWAVTP